MRLAYDGTPLPVRADEVVQAEVTTRDIDRGDAPHFLLKEIREAPLSFAKTLRGHIVEQDGHLTVALGDQVLPPSVRSRLESGTIRRVLCIGQGTAAVASQSVAALLVRLSHDHSTSTRITATELSGFHLRARHGRHPRHRRQPERDHDGHQPHRGPGPGQGGGGRSASSTAARAISRTRPTACSTRPTGATWR